MEEPTIPQPRVPVYHCTLKTLTDLTQRSYVSPKKGSVVPVEIYTSFHDRSLSDMINELDINLWDKARMILQNANAIVVEPQYIFGQNEAYASGIVVVEDKRKFADV